MADILASDVNAIRQKVSQVLGTGNASKGYGQTIYSTDVSSGQVIRKTQWDALRFDIVNIFQHQQGTIPAITQVNIGDLVSDQSGYALRNYDYYAGIATDNRFDVATGEYGITSIDNKTTSSTWSNSASATLTCTFSTSDEARYFFNSGGKIRITTTFSPSASPTQQSNAWNLFLSNIGEKDFAGNLIAATGFYTLTDTYQEYSQTSNSTPYSANYYQLAAKCDVADNSNGTAKVVTIRITLNDAYVDPDVATGNVEPPGDLVDGTLTMVAEEIKAVGVLQPTGNAFSITSPTYSMSAISVS